jgi:tripartite-type tricarboxylate transporter receptor subunit TctC
MRSVVLACALALAAVAPLRAQDYPKGPINLVIPLAAGDATDIAGRVIAEELSRELKVAIVPVNRPGGGGSIGTDSVVKAPKDGYTIVLTNNAALNFRSILDPRNVTYDPLRDLVPLGLAMRSPTVLAVRGDAAYKSLREMIDYAKRNPGKIAIATAGAGSVGDFCVRTINSVAGVELTSVPFTGASPAVTALRGGHVDGIIIALGAMTSHIKSGAFRGVATSSQYPDFPEIPTLAQLGYSQPLFGIWVGFFAPAGVPPEVPGVLVPALERAVNAREVAAKLAPLGIVPEWGPPEKLLEEIRAEHERVSQIARKAGLLQ